MIKRRYLLTLVILLCSYVAFSKVTLPDMFGSHMVLQQNSTLSLWGSTDKENNIEIFTSWNNKKYTVKPGKDGVWKVVISTSSAGGPFTIEINDGENLVLEDVLLGEVWLCSGQSNMARALEGYKGVPITNSAELIRTARNKNLRLFTVKNASSTSPANECSGEWQTVNSFTASKFSALAYQYGLYLQEYLGVPVGVINSSVGGSPLRAWTDPQTIQNFPENQKANTSTDLLKLSGFYNGMIYPWREIPLKGFLWYQGEADVVTNRELYERMFPEMVKGWRNTFHNDTLPFYYVQIAPWFYSKTELFHGAYFREMQARVQKKIPFSGIAITTDVGSDSNIHPSDKTSIAKRLLYLALENTYGVKGIVSKAPEYEGLDFKNNEAILRFRNTPLGMYLTKDCPECFEIAGEDQRFYPASARVSSDSQITVSSPEVKQPVAVRYAFKSYTRGSLFRTEGIPASSFRTDDW